MTPATGTATGILRFVIMRHKRGEVRRQRLVERIVSVIGVIVQAKAAKVIRAALRWRGSALVTPAARPTPSVATSTGDEAFRSGSGSYRFDRRRLHRLGTGGEGRILPW
jgi:hypothetical protein